MRNKGKRDIHIEKNSKMADINATLSLITLYLNRLNTLIKRQRLAKWIFKKARSCLQEIYFLFKDTNQLEVKGELKL